MVTLYTLKEVAKRTKRNRVTVYSQFARHPKLLPAPVAVAVMYGGVRVNLYNGRQVATMVKRIKRGWK